MSRSKIQNKVTGEGWIAGLGEDKWREGRRMQGEEAGTLLRRVSVPSIEDDGRNKKTHENV
jgi:hypothetical protein